MFKTFVLIALAVSASTPKNSRSYPQPYDQVWASVTAWFARNSVPVKNSVKASGLIYAERASFDDSVADCGKPGPSSLPVGRRASFNVFVNHAGSTPTVTVTAQFVETRGSGKSRAATVCVSKGVLESDLLSSISN